MLVEGNDDNKGDQKGKKQRQIQFSSPYLIVRSGGVVFLRIDNIIHIWGERIRSDCSWIYQALNLLFRPGLSPCSRSSLPLPPVMVPTKMW